MIRTFLLAILVPRFICGPNFLPLRGTLILLSATETDTPTCMGCVRTRFCSYFLAYARSLTEIEFPEVVQPLSTAVTPKGEQLRGGSMEESMPPATRGGTGAGGGGVTEREGWGEGRRE